MSAKSALTQICSSYLTSSSEEEDPVDMSQKRKTTSENGRKYEAAKKVRTEVSNSGTDARLPLPAGVLNMFKDVLNENAAASAVDYEKNHKGRIRSFPHERGNWATYVYVQCKLVLCEELHISLSRTVVLRHHWIQPFMDSLKSKLCHVPRFFITCDTLKLYINDDKTRTFLGLQVISGNHQLSQIVNIVNECLADFNLPEFYKDPSFHTSIAWCLGDEIEKLNPLLPTLQKELDDHYEVDDCQRVIRVTEIKSKSGNRIFSFPLKQ